MNDIPLLEFIVQCQHLLQFAHVETLITFYNRSVDLEKAHLLRFYNWIDQVIFPVIVFHDIWLQLLIHISIGPWCDREVMGKVGIVVFRKFQCCLNRLLCLSRKTEYETRLGYHPVLVNKADSLLPGIKFNAFFYEVQGLLVCGLEPDIYMNHSGSPVLVKDIPVPDDVLCPRLHEEVHTEVFLY